MSSDGRAGARARGRRAAGRARRRGEDLVKRWASTAVLKRRGVFVPAAEVRASFEAFCATEDAEPLNATAFGIAMRELGYPSKRRGGRMIYEGIALAAPKLRLAIDNETAPKGRALGRMVTVGARA